MIRATSSTVNFMHTITMAKEKRKVANNKPTSLQPCIRNFTTRHNSVLISIIISRSLFHNSDK